MKITIYELLGMVKDGNLPKMIKYHFQSEFEEFYVETLFELLRDADVTLYDEVEILDDEEKGLPEKLEILNANCLNGEESSYTKEAIALDITSLQNWINKLIDYLEKQRKGE